MSVLGSSMVIGAPVAAGTSGSLLFVDSNGNLGQDNACLFWDDSGFHLGIGINSSLLSGYSSAVGLHIKNPTADSSGFDSILRLEANNTSNHSGVVGEMADLQFYDGGGIGFRFIAAFGNSGPSNRYGGFIAYTDKGGNKLPIRFFTTDTAGALQDVLFLSAGQTSGHPGLVGIGTAAPTHHLQLSDDDAFKTTTSTWTTTSDARTKENIEPFTDGLEIVRRMKPVSYDYNGKAGTLKGEHSVSLIAQDTADYAPYLFKTVHTKLEETDESETDVYTFQTHYLFFLFINAIQQLEKRIAALE